MTNAVSRSVRISRVTPPRSCRHQSPRSRLVSRVRSVAKRTAGARLLPRMVTMAESSTQCPCQPAIICDLDTRAGIVWAGNAGNSVLGRGPADRPQPCAVTPLHIWFDSHPVCRTKYLRPRLPTVCGAPASVFDCGVACDFLAADHPAIL